jgi:predicted Zn-dependent peptidase
MNRSIAPELRNIDEIPFFNPKIHHLDNGIKAHEIKGGTQEIVKLDIILNTGIFFQQQQSQADATFQLLKEGTLKKSSAEIAEIIDYYGCYLNTESGNLYQTLVVYVLRKYLENICDLLNEIFTSATFPEKELEVYIAQQIQKILISNEKVNEIARNEFFKNWWGEDHNLGKISQVCDLKQLNKQKLIEFNNQFYNANNIEIIISGCTDKSSIQLLNKYFGTLQIGKKNNNWVDNNNLRVNFGKFNVNKPGAVQSAIRIGFKVFSPSNSDYFSLSFLTTLFGGYFGSRLMANIREDKGYTYGIGAHLLHQANSHALIIATEVGKEVCNETLKEIFCEIEKLKLDLVDEIELNTVKQYLMGNLLRSFDGIFEMADRYKFLILNHLDLEYFVRKSRKLLKIENNDLKRIANLAFNDKFLQITCGEHEIDN